MKTKQLKVSIALLLALVFFVWSALPVNAAYNDWHYTNWINYSEGYAVRYRYRCECEAVSNVGFFVDGYIETNPVKTVPTGYMGLNVIICEQYNGIVASTGAVYNQYYNTSLHAWVSRNVTGVYAGYISAYRYSGNNNASGNMIYNVTDTEKSPYIYFIATTSSTGVPVSPENVYPVNDCGETYGSYPVGKQIGKYADLLEATGTHGVKGYIRYDDLFYTPISQEDVIEYMQKYDEGISIPVYDLHGNVIDSFAFTGSYDYE